MFINISIHRHTYIHTYTHIQHTHTKIHGSNKRGGICGRLNRGDEGRVDKSRGKLHERGTW